MCKKTPENLIPEFKNVEYISISDSVSRETLNYLLRTLRLFPIV